MKNTVQEESRRARILEAAAHTFAEKGFHPTTVRDVARAAGVADGTIYNYFENKSALLLSLFDQMTERARAGVDPAALAAADLRGLTRLYLGGPLRALSEDNAELFRVIVSEVMVNPEVRERFFAQMLGPMLSTGEAVFARALADHGADPARLALHVRALSGLVLGLLLARLMGDQTLQDRWDELPDGLADLLLDGLLGEHVNAAELPGAPLAALEAVNITDPAFKADPFPFYARLRREAPVFPVTLSVRGRRRAWLVTRHDDVLAVLKDDARFVKDPRNAMSAAQLRAAPRLPPGFGALGRNLLSLDGADHDRLKVLVHRAFTPRRVEGMREVAQEVADAALERALRRGEMDLIADFALPVPLTVIGRILGVPEEDHPRFSRGMRAFVAIGGSPNPLLIPPMLAFVGYLRRLIRARRRRPQDDLISALVQAQEQHDHLTDDEVLAMVFLLLSAGHETTVNLIGSGTLALLEHQGELARLRADPGLIRSGVEELARYAPSAETATERYAAEDLTLAGTRIPKGELVLAVLASANRDPAVFEHPDTLDLGRSPNKHLSFGQGMHYCLGAPLSRMEAQIALGTLVQRAPGLRLGVPPSQLRWRGGLIVRGLERLPVTL